MQKTCLKCGHVNPSATGADLEACPNCGAIYSRVEAAWADSGQVRAAQPPLSDGPPSARPSAFAPMPAPAPTTRRTRYRASDTAAFLDSLRDHTNYPTFRAVVRFVEIASYLAAALLAALGGMLIKNGVYLGGIGTLLAAFYGAIVARFAKEAFFMLADGCDALVQTAAMREDP